MSDAPGTPPVPPASPTGLDVGPFTELTARRLGPIRRYFVRHPVAMDVLVVVTFVAYWSLAVVAAAPTPSTDHVRAGLIASVAASVVLYWRRRAPLLVTAAMLACLVATLATTGTTGAFELGLAFTMYAVAACRPQHVAWATLVAVLGTTTLAVIAWGADVAEAGTSGTEPIEVDPRPTSVASIAVMILIALAIGTSVRNRRQHIADLVERGNALARDREQRAELARAEERALISREMHDVVAHSLSVMIALADGAGVALERAPDKARVALAELSDTGRTALSDMRRVLGVLERDGAPLEPQPNRTDLDDMVARFRTAGLALRTRGLELPLPNDATVQLAVYRIVQESLTNALRHAPGCMVELVLEADATGIVIEVVSRGGLVPTGPSPGAGRGIIGMRERAAVYGGTVDAGPWQDGWRVRATLPRRKDVL